MSFPNFPDITPEIKLNRKDVINLLLASIAQEELSMFHILNAEGEKIQAILKKNPSLEDILSINRATEKVLRSVLKHQMLLQFKLEDIIELKKNETHLEEEHKVDSSVKEKNKDNLTSSLDINDIDFFEI